MNDLNLAALGIDQEKIAQMVADRIAEQMLNDVTYDQDGHAFRGQHDFSGALNKSVKAHLDAYVTKVADEHLLPKVAEMLESLTLQATNEWGQKKGAPVTFVEYLVQRAEAYMTEKVSFDGKTQKESGGYSWSASGTRVAHMIDKHIHYAIERAMKDAVGAANAQIAGGILETTKIKLAEIANALKVEVKTK